MEDKTKNCPICGMQIDDNHFFPTSFPGIDDKICINCDQNISLMFTNFDERPEGNGYIVPDNSDRLQEVTGRSYLENRLIYYQYVLGKLQSEVNPSNVDLIKEIKEEITKITQSIKGRNL